MYQFSKDDQYFLTLDNGITGLNMTAIARLSGMGDDHKAIRRLIDKATADLHDYEPLRCFFQKIEREYLLNHFNDSWQKVFESNYAYSIISYFAEVERKQEAISSLVSIGRIGLRAYIQHVTGYYIHSGGDSDLQALHDRLDIAEEMLRRTDHKMANLEYFRDNISKIWDLLLEFKGGYDYYRDLSVLPPQVQKNAFKHINALKDIFWHIYKLRRDCNVPTITQLSKNQIEIVKQTIPQALTTTRGVPGRGCDLKTWQWDRLFSLDFDTLYEETLKSTDKKGFSTFGKRKDISKIVCQTAKENREVKDEPLVNEIVKQFVEGYPDKIDLFGIDDYRKQNYLDQDYLWSRIYHADAAKAKLLDVDFPRFEAAKKTYHDLMFKSVYLHTLSKMNGQLYTILHTIYYWIERVSEFTPVDHVPYAPARVLPPDPEWVSILFKPEYQGKFPLEIHHSYYSQVAEAVFRGERSIGIMAERFNIPIKNRLLMLRIYKTINLKRSDPSHQQFSDLCTNTGNCLEALKQVFSADFKDPQCKDSDFLGILR